MARKGEIFSWNRATDGCSASVSWRDQTQIGTPHSCGDYLPCLRPSVIAGNRDVLRSAISWTDAKLG